MAMIMMRTKLMIVTVKATMTIMTRTREVAKTKKPTGSTGMQRTTEKKKHLEYDHHDHDGDH